MINHHKSGFPYLVDISFTRTCALAHPNGCHLWNVCYASPQSGKPPIIDLTYCESVLKELMDSNVFELVLGGESEATVLKFMDAEGDVNGLEKFNEIAKNLHFKVGLTTRNYGLWRQDNFASIMSSINSLAISVNTIEDLQKAKILIEKIKETASIVDKPSIYLQDVLETKSIEDTILFLKEAKTLDCEGITFLGWKEFGRGAGTKPFEFDVNWIDIVRNEIGSFGVDSILVQRFKQEFLDRGVDEFYLVGKEGSSSCYLDLEKRVVKPSSFTDVEYPYQVGQFLNIFRSF